MNREIVKYPNPLLKKKSEEVKEISEDIKILIEDMIETMIKNKGVGLAAPQVGESKRIIIVQTEKGSKVFINPIITKRSWRKEIMEEGCLSFPGPYLKIKRATEIEVNALNEKGERIKTKAQGLIARIIQHEIDHLDGILIFNRLSFWQRFKNKNKFQWI